MEKELLHEGMHGAFIKDGFGLPLQGHHTCNILQGLRLAAKDIFDVAGATCGAGNPDWKKTQSIATVTAPAIQWLLDAGALWVGKTVSDELTYSLSGINAHYGTPTNPSAPDRVPGGSSSGSVVAIAGEHADIALGSDCAGSIRLPSSYCGVWGMRSSHGRISGKGCLTLAHSFDTIGVFAREGEVLQKTMSVLFGSSPKTIDSLTSTKYYLSEDLCAQLDDEVKEAFLSAINALGIKYQVLPIGTFNLIDWANAFRVLQSREIALQYSDWIKTAKPTFGADVAARFAQAEKVTADEVSKMQEIRAFVHTKMSQILADGVILTPPVPGPAIPLTAPLETVNAVRGKSFRMLCLAGLAGLPQVVMPWTLIDGAPVGLSLIGARYSDEVLIAQSIKIYDELKKTQ